MRECMMILRTNDKNGRPFSGVYVGAKPFRLKNYDVVFKNGVATLKGVELVDFMNLRVHGRNYRERQNSLRNVAVDYSYFDTDGMSLAEIGSVVDWFEKMGKRYGLLGEFRENAVC